jgi:recombination protein RecT
MKPERMMRLMANAIRTTPKLGECDPMSLLGGLMTCAGLGLEPNTIMGHAYLIPFKNNRKGITEVQLVVGYKGLIDLARRSGHITSISANIHYSDDDVWEYEEGTEARLRHIPGAQEGDKRHAYAIAKFRDGGHAYVVLPWAKVMKIRNGSWAGKRPLNSTRPIGTLGKATRMRWQKRPPSGRWPNTSRSRSSFAMR